uniref:SAP domain-containing protein n=1 Tax=Bionectria ochroleuca TaxID=29856 RepID=A0A0B7KKN3_BIOOC
MPPLQPRDVNLAVTPAKRRPGRKRKSLEDRIYSPPKPVRRVERSYPDHQKIKVLMFLHHHRVFVRRVKSPDYYRPPSQQEAADFFQIPQRTIGQWVRQKDEIIQGKPPRYSPQWPLLEEALMKEFHQARKLAIFTFSNGWWTNFKLRNNLSRRRVTRRATKTPEEAVPIVNNFLRFIRRISNQRSTALDRILVTMSPTRRFRRGCIVNIDETPIPFEYLDGYTYEVKGTKTIQGKSDRSGWNKRQATLILYIFADGIQRLKPKVIFHGKPEGQIFENEGYLYSPDVTVEFNDTAYNNEELFRYWIANELAVILDGKEHMLVMDVASFHTTDDVLQDLRSRKITTALIPPGCTSLLQPLDTTVNKPFKQWLAEAAFTYVEQHDPDGTKKWSVQDKRVMTTHTVAAACKRLSEQPDLVSNAFLQCGISIRPDGSQDDKIRIKDVPAEAIDFSNWEKAEQAVVNAYEIVDQLCDDEEITVSEDDLTIALKTLRITDLKELLRLRGLTISGKKKDLIERLENHILAAVGSSQQASLYDNY